MSAAHTSHKDDIPCPDPSVHSQFSRDHELQNSASKAALLAADSKKTGPTPKAEFDVLGPDGKLSSAGAASSLKYARAQDLPAFPSVGIDASSSGNKAANLAAANHKQFEYWKPESSTSAGKAANIAANHGGKVDLWKYKADGTGNSAANIAMGRNSSPQLDYGYTEQGHKSSLLAATQSLKISDKPVPSIAALSGNYPDSANATSNALNAATVAHRPGTRTSNDMARMSERGMEASRVQHTQGVSREMYGERPPVSVEEEEKKHQAALRASAISMAKSLYEIEKPAMERIAAGDSAARRAHAEHYATEQSKLTTGDGLKMQAMNYVKVQEQAQRLAAERLAKLDPDGVMAYQEHYGYSKQGRSRLSMRGRHQRTTSGDTEEVDSSDDEAQAARIKLQQRGFNQKVADVDQDKRTTDRANLLAAAQKAVKARMATMDEKVFADTGKVSPAMMAEWEAKAQAKAAADSNERMLTHGKVHIGGGRYMDQSEIDAIAAARMQPTLDEINETATLQRAREAEIKADQQRRAEEAKLEKERQADIKRVQNETKARQKAEVEAEKAEQKRLKNEEKVEAKRVKDEEKARAAEEKRTKKEFSKREAEQQTQIKATDAEAERLRKEAAEEEAKAEKARVAEAEAAERERLATERIEAAEEEVAATEVVETTVTPALPVEAETSTPVVTEEIERPRTAETTIASPSSTAATPVSPRRESKLKGLFSRMKRPSSKVDDSSATSSVVGTTTAVAPPVEVEDDAEKYKSGTGEGGASAELTARSKNKAPADTDSVSSVSTVTPSGAVEPEEEENRGRQSIVSSNDQWEEARDRFDDEANAPSATFARDSVEGSPGRSSRSKFQEEL